MRPALPLALALALAAPALADELRWADAQTWRYTLELKQAPASFPTLVNPAPQRLLHPASFPDGRTPGWPVSDLGGLVWYYALQVPVAEAPRKAAKLEVDDRFEWSGGGVTAKGEHAVRRKGRTLLLVTRVELAPLRDGDPLKRGTLQVQRVFDTRQGRMLEASFELALRAQAAAPSNGPAPEAQEASWSGALAPADPLDLASSDFHRDVEESIQQGATWLKRELPKRLASYKKQHSDHYAMGRVALLAFALLRSGVAARELDDTFAWLREQPFQRTYSVSLYVMALEARSIARTALPPLDASRSVARYDREPIPPQDEAEIERAVRWLLAVRGEKGWWSYGGIHEDGAPQGPAGHDGTTPAKSGDRSNAQFAILALHSAAASGVEVPREVWEAVLAELLAHQAKDGPQLSLGDSELSPASPFAHDPRDQASGTRERSQEGLTSDEREAALARGWSYGMTTPATAANSYGSMSAAGLSSLAVAREALHAAEALTAEKDREALVGVRDGLGWLLHHFDVAENPGRGSSHYYYYLYSLEKALDLAGVERLGRHEWWREGAAELLQRQDKAGNWGGAEDTALALLFLNRATLPARLDVEAIGPVATGRRDPSRWDEVAVEGVGKLRARQVLRALLRAGARELKERVVLADQVLDAMDEAQATRLVPELIQLQEAAPKPVRKWAAKRCRTLTGTDVIAELADLADRFERLHREAELADPGTGVPAALEALAANPTPQLERAALRTLVRVRGVEAVPQVLGLLDVQPAERREAAHLALLSLVGERHPFEPRAPSSARADQLAAWRAWWEAEGGEVVTEERVRRALLAFDDPERAKAAQVELRRIGRPAVRPLIDLLREEGARRARAHALLKQITGEALPAELEPWLEWWERTGR